MRADLHLHTTASDGTDSPAALVRLSAERGMDIIAVTDHDTVAGIREAREALPHGMTLINGVEFSCVTDGEDGFRCHILGYGIDPDSEPIRHAIELGVQKRRDKLMARLAYLSENFGICFTDGEIKELSSYNSVGKLHIARYIIKKGYADSVAEAIDRYLGMRLPDDRIDTGIAIRAILDCGGVPVYAHPLGGEREPRIDGEELRRRVGRLMEYGIMGLEAYYSRYTAADRGTIIRVAEDCGLLLSGGSDYHGSNKTVPFACLSADGEQIDSSRLTVLGRLMADGSLR